MVPEEFLLLTDAGVDGDLVGDASVSQSSLWFWSASESSFTETSEPEGIERLALFSIIH